VDERDLIIGVLAAQAGFATPSEVLAAAAAGLVDGESDSLLTRLGRTGALSAERRKILEALAEQALAARNGDAHAVLTALGESPTVIETLVSEMSSVQEAPSPSSTGREIPLERPGQYTRLGELGRGSQSVVRAARDEIIVPHVRPLRFHDLRHAAIHLLFDAGLDVPVVQAFARHRAPKVTVQRYGHLRADPPKDRGRGPIATRRGHTSDYTGGSRRSNHSQSERRSCNNYGDLRGAGKGI
jgi:hypothetical protein